MGLIARLDEFRARVLLVPVEVALEPADLAAALEREDVGGDPIEEPAIVGDGHGAQRTDLLDRSSEQRDLALRAVDPDLVAGVDA